MKGPIRIKSDNSSSTLKKPVTPDALTRLNKNTHNNVYNNPIQRPNSVKKKQMSTSTSTQHQHELTAHSRPSTAPHKDKGNMNNPMLRSGGSMIHNNNMRNNNVMPGNGKRLPSPQIHSNNSLSKTQKINPARYRAPSPVVKSSGSNAMMLGGTIKRGSNNVYGKF
jgi:hypothetical protein